MPSAVKPVSAADLAAWPTERLLALRDRLLRCTPDIDHSDIQRPEEIATLDPSLIHFKDDARWTELYETVKRILNTREHVPGGSERAARRKARAKQGRSRERAKPAPRRSRR
jgi:hypothetical protein